MGVTEIALFPLKAGLNAHDTSSPANRIWVEALNTVVSQPGARRAVYGMELENPTNFRLYVEWDKVEDHERFTKSAAYQPMLNNLEPLFGGEPFLRHIAPKPFPSPALSPNIAPTIEVFTAYFPADVSQADQDKYAAAFEQFSKKGLPGKAGTSGGWSLEADIPNPKDGKPGKVFLAFIGWASKEEHMEWREKEEFRSSIHLLREGPVTLEAVHIKPEEIVAGLS